MTTTLNALPLPPDLLWTDEFAWQAVEQRTQYSITGALLIETAAKQAGRPITLTGGANHGWISRADLVTLRGWANSPGMILSLVLRSEAARDVAFDHARGAIEAAPIIDYSDPAADDYYSVTLRFIEV